MKIKFHSHLSQLDYRSQTKGSPLKGLKSGQDHPNVNLLSSLNLMQMFMLKKELIDQLMNISEIQEIMTEVTLRNVLSAIQYVYF